DAAAAVHDSPSAAVVRLREAIATRLLLADDVARYKWNHDLPVFDAQREAVVIEHTTAAAVALGIPHDYAERVVAAQIAASRDRQQASIDRWRGERHPAFADVPDLATAQRPALDRATTELLAQLSAAKCELDSAAHGALDAPPTSLADSVHAWSTAVG